MKVNMVWATPDPEKIIAEVARVSNPENQKNPEYNKLIKYLIKNQHWSPFEHSYMCCRIVTSRAVATQMIRHRSFSWQEFSQRYSEVTEIEPIELRQQADKNRQSSTEVFDPLVYNKDMDIELNASDIVSLSTEYSMFTYERLIKAGVAKECVRMVLPLATQTTLYMTGSCRSWIHYLALRNDSHTQKEHQLIAQEIEKLFAMNWPCTYGALEIIKKENEDKELLYKLLLEGKITL